MQPLLRQKRAMSAGLDLGSNRIVAGCTWHWSLSLAQLGLRLLSLWWNSLSLCSEIRDDKNCQRKIDVQVTSPEADECSLSTFQNYVTLHIGSLTLRRLAQALGLANTSHRLLQKPSIAGPLSIASQWPSLTTVVKRR